MWIDIITASATTVAAIAAAATLRVVIRYTDETTRMRVAAEEQAKAAQEQLSVAQKTLYRTIGEQRRASHPLIIWMGDANQSGGTFSHGFVNRGGSISNCYLNCAEARNAGVVNGEFIGSGESGTVQLQFDSAQTSFSFEFCYTTQRGEIASQKFDVHIENDGKTIVRLIRGPEAIG
jgi:hypothetical protein